MNELTNIFNYGDSALIVKTVVKDNEVLFDVEDVAKALGLTTTVKGKTYVRWSRVNEYLPKSLPEVAKGDLIPEPLVYKLAFKSETEISEAFTDWLAIEVIPSIRKQGSYSIEQANRPYLLETTKEEFGIAEIIVASTGVRKEIAFATAIDRTEKRTGESLAEYKLLLPSAEHDTGFMNATEVGEHIGLKPVKANKMLESLELQYQEEYEHKGKTKKQWRLTDEGKLYGEEFPFTRNGHSGYQIRWNKAVLNKIKEQPAQQQVTQ
ncbi:BRO family protein [Priestia flexa]|uniref:BRO-N domain-containing protein n=1 Tax=Priestia flexa TaxID=86664 RepID=UPI000C249C60|nr:BRO family protein [Priestia flexa]MEC0667062.1 BRO family protein [Priestia flexa]